MLDFRKLRIGGGVMINTTLLNDYINKSGLSNKSIAESLNIIVKHQEKVFFAEV